ncbi:hypothetical protein OIE66_30305 [Nonomuraea sp. NBC_01738]|uniref:ATP-grasp domain-containing protein n=1 Tax=Nonomuraea sp. NBC_01738 TaxID=2976003 RepID=UPI002E0DD044|nr:hypothetical protein OIE66_30305 [Nonomuraea sp. NBC_01738]
MISCAYVTFDANAALDDERDVALAAWAEAGIEGTPVVWSDPGVDWSRFDAAVVRSVWDYTDRRAEFLRWAERVEGQTRLLNPAAILRGNTDKTYLRDLAAPTVPTHWSADDLPHWPEYVVKPAISAGAKDTIRTADRAVAEAHARSLESAGRTAMIQPYLDMVEAEGETSLLYFNRRLSHAVRRTPMLTPGKSDADNARAVVREPAPDQVELAEKVLAAIPQALLYARVDLVRLADGAPAVIELELTEPYLYLRYTPSAPKDFALALRELVAG